MEQKRVNRENGYYWVRIKRTKLWIIAKWMNTYQWWVTMNLENDTRGGFDMVVEKRIKPPVIVKPEIKRVRKIKPEIKRVRRNDKETNDTKLSKPQKHPVRVRRRS